MRTRPSSSASHLVAAPAHQTAAPAAAHPGARFREIAPGPETPARAVASLRGAASAPDPAAAVSGPRLSAFSLLVVGLGGVGRPAALHLARLSPRALWLVDPDRYTAENLASQAIGPPDVGTPKASTTARLAKAVSPATRVLAYDGRWEDLDPADLLPADGILLAGDNLSLEGELGRLCLRLGKPLVSGSVHGGSLTATARVYGNTARGATACPMCAYTRGDWEHLRRETRFSCADYGRMDAPTIAAPPTGSPSFLCSIAADLAVVQLVRHLLGLGKPVVDTELEYNAFTHKTLVTPLARNPVCPSDHAAWRVLRPTRPLASAPLRDLLAAAGAGGAADATVTVGKLAFAESGRCRAGHLARLRRFVDPWAAAGSCATCGAPNAPDPFTTHRPAPVALFGPDLDRPLGELCDGAPAWVAVAAGGETTWFARPDALSTPETLAEEEAP